MDSNKNIAIIGISIKVADAGNLEEFWQLLGRDETAFHPLSDLRRKISLTGLAPLTSQWDLIRTGSTCSIPDTSG